MKKFKNIEGFCEIKLKTDYCELKGAIYSINGLIYKYKESYAFQPLVKQLIAELTAEGVKIDSLKITEKYQKQKADAIDRLKKLIYALRDYLNEYSVDKSFEDAIIISLRFQIRSFLKVRDEKKLSVENCLDMLRRNQLLYNSKREIEKSLNISIQMPNFIKLQDDIKRELYKFIDVYDFGKSN